MGKISGCIMKELEESLQLMVEARSKLLNYLYGVSPGKELPTDDETLTVRQVIEDLEALESEIEEVIEDNKKPKLRVVK